MAYRAPSRAVIWTTGLGLFLLLSGAAGGSGFVLSARVRLWSGIAGVLIGLYLWWREGNGET